jgi:hypothetical protein
LADLFIAGRISCVNDDGSIDVLGFKSAASDVTIDLLDPITLCAVTAWVASRLLGEEGQVFGPHEVVAYIDYGALILTAPSYGATSQWHREIPTPEPPSTRGLALALKAAIEAIAAGTITR